MKKKILFLGLSFILVASMISASVLTSCGKTSTTTSTNTTTTSTTAANTPQYGGTLTMYPFQGTDVNITNWACLTSGGQYCTNFIMPYLCEGLLVGDFEKYGPRGTNEFGFQVNQYIPNAYLTGDLAETWELTTSTLTFNMRHGVMWAGNTNIGMAKRELTADDVVIMLNYAMGLTKQWGMFSWIDSLEATDKYTVLIQINKYDDGMLREVGFIPLYCPEAIKADPSSWQHQVSCGPFIVADYIAGSQASYDRNPDYWRKTTINGKQYSIPFVDHLVVVTIPDESAQLAALRTAKLDYDYEVSLKYKSSLTTSSPNLMMNEYERGSVMMVAFNCTNKIFKDVNVRRALMMGTDLQAIGKAVYLDYNEFSYPFNGSLPKTIHIALSDMPAGDQALYTYDPVKAKQMLADAGYPTGFTMTLDYTGTVQNQGDVGALLVDQWSKLGVTLKLQPKDGAVIGGELFTTGGGSFTDTIMMDWGNTNPIQIINTVTPRGGNQNIVQLNDPILNSGIDALKIDQSSGWAAHAKALGLQMIHVVPQIGLPTSYTLLCYWPWIKNYYNELEAAQYDTIHPLACAWIDQSVKTKLGY